jgi:hypothetical protein
MTFKPRTHYEQVPLEIVKKIARVEEPDETTKSAEAGKKPQKEAAAASAADSANHFKFASSSFDIFQVEDDGNVLWHELCPTLEEAKARVSVLQASLPRRFMIASLKSGDKIFINPDSPRPSQGQSAPLDSCGQC